MEQDPLSVFPLHITLSTLHRREVLREEGAEGQTCTGDTTLFRRVLYYLSYLGTRSAMVPTTEAL